MRDISDWKEYNQVVRKIEADVEKHLDELKPLFKNGEYKVVYQEGDVNKHKVHSILIVEDYRTRHNVDVYYIDNDYDDFTTVVDVYTLYNIDNV